MLKILEIYDVHRPRHASDLQGLWTARAFTRPLLCASLWRGLAGQSYTDIAPLDCRSMIVLAIYA